MTIHIPLTKFKERKKRALNEINEFIWFTNEEKTKIIKQLRNIDSITNFEEAYRYVKNKMSEIKK